MSSALPRSLPRPSCSSSSSCSSTSRSIRRSLSTTPFRRNQNSAPLDPAPPIASSSSQLHQRPPPPPLHHHPSPPPPPPPSSSTPTSSTSEPRFVPLDIQDFLRGYPLFRKNRWNQLNALFYANEQLATPSDWTIEDLLSRLRKNPELLRDDHAAFEWLFPLPERSGNLECWRLEPHETQAISTNPLQMNRLIRAYDAALRIYGITLVDRESGLLRANSTFKDRITHLPTTPSQTLRLTRILKSLTVLSPLPPSPLSVLHHIPSLILFLLAHHNDPHSPLDLSPNTPGGEALEMRWGMCIRNKAFREMVQGMIGSRRGTTAEENGLGGQNWGVKEYENWVVSRSTTSTSSSEEEEAAGGQKKKKTITVAEAVKRGVSSRAKESEWLDSQATKRAFLTPSGVSLKRRQPVGANSDSNPAGGVFDAEAWMEDEEEEGKRRQEGEWEEVVSYAAEESLGEGEGGEGEGAEVEEKWEEEEKELDLEGAIGRVLEREDDEDEEGWEREVGVTGGEGKKKD
ncbi:opioid growth factor receptor conserved region-domain-containing protein [Mrakia frigida]|uniref:opioid growth factor receptor conserved region-domain-containing protein n=1 Tax=Mrakia frigida TaxID=29902 RepID=UPI003FCC0F52